MEGITVEAIEAICMICGRVVILKGTALWCQAKTHIQFTGHNLWEFPELEEIPSA